MWASLRPLRTGAETRRATLRNARQRLSTQRLVLWTAVAGVGYLVLGPLLVTLVATFKERGVLPFEPGFTLENYRSVFLSARTYELLWNTGAFTIGSLALGATLAILFSWLLERTDLPWRNLQFALVVAPMAVPGMLSAIAWIFLLDPTVGTLNQMIQALVPWDMARGPLNIYTLWGMIFVEGVRMVPSIFLMTSASFRSMDPALEEASRVAGAGSFATIRRITIPVMRPAILAALLYYLIVIIESFEIPGVVGLSAGRHVFSTAIYRSVYPVGGGLSDYGLASTLGLILVAIAAVTIWFYQRMTWNARRFITISGKGYRPRRVDLGRWKYAALALTSLYFLIALALPLFMLAWRSVQPYYTQVSLAAWSDISFDAYRTLADYPGMLRAFRNTLVLSLIAATGTMVLAFLAGWFTARLRTRLVRALDLLTFIPHAVASVVIALGVLLLYVSFPNPLYGTVYLIALAGVTRYLSYATRLVSAGVMQCDPALEEASLLSNAGWFRTYLKITMPLLGAVLINGWVWVAVHSARELSVALMLYTPSSIVVSTSIWSMWEIGNTGVAAALGTILIIILVILTWGVRTLMIRRAHF